MKKKIIGIFICTLLIATVLSVAKPETRVAPQPSSSDGITFGQVDFLFVNGTQNNSHWGHIEIDIVNFLAQYHYDEGFLNIYTNAGWVVQNRFIEKIDGMKNISFYFNLGVTPGYNVTQLTAYLEFTPYPYVQFGDGPRNTYLVRAVGYNAGGLGQSPPSVPDFIEPIIFDQSGLTYHYTKPNLNDNENVQCAANQCAPMSCANSLQYLENRNLNFNVPHNHVIGLKGDNSLVGQLDTAMDREVTSRIIGQGVYADVFFEGKFQYLADNGLADRLIHRHQGNGYFHMPAGDVTYHGITSTDESVDGKATFDWIERQLRSCEDVEVFVKWGAGGGHAVRVFGCGVTLGKPYLQYKHDRLQTNHDPTDTRGLEEVQVYVNDLDGDGLMNWESKDNEIVQAISESVNPLDIHIYDRLYRVASANATISNTGESNLTIKWSIDVEGMLVLIGSHTEGTISLLPAGTEEIESSLIFGLGPADVTVTAVSGMYNASKIAKCFLFGPFLLNYREV